MFNKNLNYVKCCNSCKYKRQGYTSLYCGLDYRKIEKNMYCWSYENENY